jgi:integrase
MEQSTGPQESICLPSPHLADQPISTVKTAWRATLRRAGVAHFPIYNLRHVFCTRLSGVAADAVVQRAMRHTSPETKRRYQLGMTDQVRQAMEKSNKKAYGRTKVLRFYDVRPRREKEGSEGGLQLIKEEGEFGSPG